ncbi:hypothetical protein K438DRAFT_1762312 [Mycena galopus ATCC 62051]|nr:hypothetical protein K438DRAFT_1762312 [Mycena galopus ATCC 62051]
MPPHGAATMPSLPPSASRRSRRTWSALRARSSFPCWQSQLGSLPPPPSSNRNTSEGGSGTDPTRMRLTALLSLSKPPTRASLLAAALAHNVLHRTPPTITCLYHILEVTFNPLTLYTDIAPILAKLHTSSMYGAYVPLLECAVLSCDCNVHPAHEADLQTKAQLQRMVGKYEKRRGEVIKKWDKEYAKRKDAAGRKIEEEKAKRCKAVATKREECKVVEEVKQREQEWIVAKGYLDHRYKTNNEWDCWPRVAGFQGKAKNGRGSVGDKDIQLTLN